MATFVKILFAACLLYLSSKLSDASSFATVTSLTSSVVEQSVAAHAQRNVFGHGKQAYRFKREVLTKKLDDPKECIKSCREVENTNMTGAMIRNIARLVALSLADVKGDETSTPEKEAAFTKKIEERTIANMGPLFEDLCKIQKSKGLCISKCPESQARSILLIDNEGSQAVFCEPSRNWNNFSDYYTAIDCTNNTEAEKPCDKKCGPEIQMSEETKLDIDEQEIEGEDDEAEEIKPPAAGPVVLSYETDAKKNTATAGSVCKAITCQAECYKPIVTKKCGAKAAEMYNRLQKVEPRDSLRILKLLNAVNSHPECKVYE